MSRMLVCDTHDQRVPNSRNTLRHCPGCEQDMLRRIREGEPLRTVAADYGLTGERIRQIVISLDPQVIRLGQAVRRERQVVLAEAREQVKLASRQRLLTTLPPCVVCWGPMQRPSRGAAKGRVPQGRTTCSPRCRELWYQLRYHLDPDLKEQHRLTIARRALQVGRPGQQAWATNLLAGTSRQDPNRWRPYSATVTAGLAEVSRLREGRMPPPGALPVPTFEFQIRHGTVTGYRQGCRLECCRAVKTASRRAQRQALRARRRAAERGSA